MCAAFELNDRKIRPGLTVACWVSTKTADQRAWTGFATTEKLRWWKAQGGVLVDIPARRFAERSDQTGFLIWDDLPAGCVIRGLAVEERGKPHLKVVTRAATDAERAQFQHDRMPVLAAPLFSAEPVTGLAPLPARPQQTEWF